MASKAPTFTCEEENCYIYFLECLAVFEVITGLRVLTVVFNSETITLWPQWWRLACSCCEDLIFCLAATVFFPQFVECSQNLPIIDRPLALFIYRHS